jgi:hypothetical protein
MQQQKPLADVILKCSRAPVCTDSVSAVYRDSKKKWKIKQINGSLSLKKRAPRENGP